LFGGFGGPRREDLMPVGRRKWLRFGERDTDLGRGESDRGDEDMDERAKTAGSVKCSGPGLCFHQDDDCNKTAPIGATLHCLAFIYPSLALKLLNFKY